MDRFSEIVFGVIMALSFTGTISIATAGEQDIRQLLYAALGCNLAWGIVDGVMYVISNLVKRGRALSTARSIASTGDARTARNILIQSLPEDIVKILPVTVINDLKSAIAAGAHTLQRPRITRDDLLGAIGIFMLVAASTLPVALPFMLLTDAELALRTSNGIALIIMFLCGYAIGHHAGFGAWRSGAIMLIIGAALVMVTLVLGG